VGDYLYKVFSPRPKELAHFGFNPSNIMGAVDLYRVTGDRKYLELASIFVDMRGSRPGGSHQNQDAVPLRKEREAVGHCVTATYLWCGAADVYAETGDRTLLDALLRLWTDVTTRKMYVTGGTAVFHNGLVFRQDLRWPREPVHEAFGPPYQLPNRTAYNETCANIGNAMWNWRLLNLTGEARFADVMERVLYNSMLSGIGLKGTDFFYTNPLRRCGPEVPLLHNDSPTRWPDTTPASPVHCFCCPPNVARTLAKLHRWAYSLGDQSVWVNLYGSNVLDTTLPDGSRVRLEQTTDYPWDGHVTLVVRQAPSKPLSLKLRIPGWTSRAELRLNGQPLKVDLKPGRYAEIRRRWTPGDRLDLNLSLDVVFVQANPLVEEARGQVAVMRGPVVYCLESPDLPEDVSVDDVAVVPSGKWSAQWQPDLLGGVVVVEGDAVVVPHVDWKQRLYARYDPTVPPRRIRVRLIPYYAWANRGRSEMTVWLPVR